MSKRYKVTGTQAFEGHAPGESFDGGLTEGQEAFGVSIGAIKVISTDVEHDQRFASTAEPEKTRDPEPQADDKAAVTDKPAAKPQAAKTPNKASKTTRAKK